MLFFLSLYRKHATDGGTLYLGVNDKGEIPGLEAEQIARYKKEIANLSNNPQKLDPPYLLFPREETIGDKNILIVQVPLSSQLHRHKGEIYLRSDEGDYRVKGAHLTACFDAGTLTATTTGL